MKRAARTALVQVIDWWAVAKLLAIAGIASGLLMWFILHPKGLVWVIRWWMTRGPGVLLLVLALVAIVCLIGGIVEALGASRVTARRRRRRPAFRPDSSKAVDTMIPRSSARHGEATSGGARESSSGPAARAVERSRPPGPRWSPVRSPPPDATTHEEPGASRGKGPSRSRERPSREQAKMVLHYADGRILKGFSHDFSRHEPTFHLAPLGADSPGTVEPTTVRLDDLKAVFFVRDFVGDSTYNERKEFLPGENPPGRKIEVTFADGEVLVGSTYSYRPGLRGFFLIPADPQSNNRIVFAISRTVTKVRVLP